MEGKERVLIVGSTGMFGRLLVKASLALGHPTFVLFRPQNVHDVDKCQLYMNFMMDGARLIQGSLDDEESLIAALKQVDVVLSAVGGFEILNQLKLVEAIKQVGSIKRFFPSEFGMDVDRLDHSKMPYGKELFLDKQVVRRAIEKANIPYTYMSPNCLARFFVAGLAQMATFMPPRDHVKIYSQGDKKAIWVVEEDAAMYTMLCVSDPRALNKTVYVRPPANILTQLEVVNIWERIIGKDLHKTFISEEEWFTATENETSENEKGAMGHFYHIFFREVLYFELEGPHVEDTQNLFPNHKYVTVEEYLKRFA